MRYINIKPNLKYRGEILQTGDELIDFEKLPRRNQEALLNMGWARPDNVSVRKPKTKTRSKPKTQNKSTSSKKIDMEEEFNQIE